MKIIKAILKHKGSPFKTTAQQGQSKAILKNINMICRTINNVNTSDLRFSLVGITSEPTARSAVPGASPGRGY